MLRTDGAWRCMVMEAAGNLNEHKEAHEKEKKDERKKIREESTQPATQDLEVRRARMWFCRADKGGSGQPCQTEA